MQPDNPKHWFKTFLDSGDVDIYHQSYVIDDGALPPKVVEELKKEYAGTVYYNRFILGQWAPAEGLVYAFFRPDVDPVPSTALPSCGTWYISIDYGTANPCSMGLWCIADGKAYREDEYYHDSRKARRQHTDEEYYRALEDLAGIGKSRQLSLTLLRRPSLKRSAAMEGLQYTRQKTTCWTASASLLPCLGRGAC